MSPERPSIQGFDHLQRIAANALGDDAYRQRLVSDPHTVLKEEGLTVPDGVQVTIHENTADHVHLVLPTGIKEAHQLRPAETDVTELNEGFIF
jgi:hypothetical protein